jgi:hypothetical protein
VWEQSEQRPALYAVVSSHDPTEQREEPHRRSCRPALPVSRTHGTRAPLSQTHQERGRQCRRAGRSSRQATSSSRPPVVTSGKRRAVRCLQVGVCLHSVCVRMHEHVNALLHCGGPLSLLSCECQSGWGVGWVGNDRDWRWPARRKGEKGKCRWLTQ